MRSMMQLIEYALHTLNFLNLYRLRTYIYGPVSTYVYVDLSTYVN